ADDLEFIEHDAHGMYLAAKESHALLARQVAIDSSLEPQTAYLDKFFGYEPGEAGTGLPNATRIGEESLAVVPVYVSSDGWRLTPDEAVFDPDRIDRSLAQRLHDRQINVSRKALVKHLASQPRPPAFEEQA